MDNEFDRQRAMRVKTGERVKYHSRDYIVKDVLYHGIATPAFELENYVKKQYVSYGLLEFQREHTITLTDDRLNLVSHILGDYKELPL